MAATLGTPLLSQEEAGEAAVGSHAALAEELPCSWSSCLVAPDIVEVAEAAEGRRAMSVEELLDALDIAELRTLARQHECTQADIAEVIGLDVMAIAELPSELQISSIMEKANLLFGDVQADRPLQQVVVDGSELGSDSDSTPRDPRCAICLDDLEGGSCPEEYQSAECRHTYHRLCFEEHLSSRIREGMISELRCPECPRQVSPEEVHALVAADVAARFDRLSALRALTSDPNRRGCPAPDCEGVVLRPYMLRAHFVAVNVLVVLLWEVAAAAVGIGLAVLSDLNGSVPDGSWIVSVAICMAGATAGILLASIRVNPPEVGGQWQVWAQSRWPAACRECDTQVCFSCGELWHEGAPCAQARSQLVEAWAASTDAMRCPRCSTMIERSEGCNHMTCKRAVGGCGYEFCWICGETYSPQHFDGARGGCRLFGGSSLTSRTPFKDSWLGTLRAPLLFATGVALGETFLLPTIGALTWINVCAVLAVGFLMLHLRSWDGSLGPCGLVLAPFGGAALVKAWFELDQAVGDLSSSVLVVLLAIVSVFTVMGVQMKGLRAKEEALPLVATMFLAAIAEGVGLGLLSGLCQRYEQHTLAPKFPVLKWIAIIIGGLVGVTLHFVGKALPALALCCLFEKSDQRQVMRGYRWQRWVFIAVMTLTLAPDAIPLSPHFCHVGGVISLAVSAVGFLFVSYLVISQVLCGVGLLPPLGTCLLAVWWGRLLLEASADVAGVEAEQELGRFLGEVIRFATGALTAYIIVKSCTIENRRRRRILTCTCFLLGGVASVLAHAIVQAEAERLAVSACVLAWLSGSMVFRLGLHTYTATP